MVSNSETAVRITIPKILEELIINIIKINLFYNTCKEIILKYVELNKKKPLQIRAFLLNPSL